MAYSAGDYEEKIACIESVGFFSRRIHHFNGKNKIKKKTQEI